MKTPNYVLTQDFVAIFGVQDQKILPAGSFVKPVEFTYVPKHVIEGPYGKSFNKRTDVFCYTRIGFISIPRAWIREV